MDWTCRGRVIIRKQCGRERPLGLLLEVLLLLLLDALLVLLLHALLRDALLLFWLLVLRMLELHAFLSLHAFSVVQHVL
jgi:hypothetical protein